MNQEWDFADLSALFVNCTLKRSPEVSNTQALADLSIGIMERHGVSVEVIRAVDHEIATGIYPDMTEHGWDRDDWPAIAERVMEADILVLLSPIWLGEKSSVCTRHVSDLEPAPPRAYAARRRGDPRARQPTLRVGRRLPLRLREPGVPLRL